MRHTPKSMRLLFLVVFLITSVSCSQYKNPKSFFDKGDYKKAYVLWLPLANNGDLDAQNFLGIQHYLGLGVERNLGLAKKWFEKASVAGLADAQHNLGVMYENGEHVEQDLISASMWFYVATKNGNVNAKKRIQRLLNDDKVFPNQFNHAKDLAQKYLNTKRRD